VAEGLSRQGGCGRCASEGIVCGSIARRGKGLGKPRTTQEAGRLAEDYRQARKVEL